MRGEAIGEGYIWILGNLEIDNRYSDAAYACTAASDIEHVFDKPIDGRNAKGQASAHANLRDAKPRSI